MDRTNRTVRTDDARFDIVGCAALQCSVDCALHTRPIQVVKGSHKCVIADGHASGLVAEDPKLLVRPAHGSAVEVPVPATQVRTCLSFQELTLLLLDFCFGIPPLELSTCPRGKHRHQRSQSIGVAQRLGIHQNEEPLDRSAFCPEWDSTVSLNAQLGQPPKEWEHRPDVPFKTGKGLTKRYLAGSIHQRIFEVVDEIAVG